jgi:hypothetical protein
VYRDFEVGVNYNYAEFKFDQARIQVLKLVLIPPKHRVKASFGNELFKNFGFNVSGRYNTEYLWQSTMVDGLIAAATVVDAQIIIISKLKTLKLGASNIGGKNMVKC